MNLLTPLEDNSSRCCGKRDVLRDPYKYFEKQLLFIFSLEVDRGSYRDKTFEVGDDEITPSPWREREKRGGKGVAHNTQSTRPLFWYGFYFYKGLYHCFSLIRSLPHSLVLLGIFSISLFPLITLADYLP